MKNLHDKRQVYEKFELKEDEILSDPMAQFAAWYGEAERDSGIAEANAMCLSTLDADGCPRTRVVLLKSFDQSGLVFFTNYQSKKGRSLAEAPLACLSFFWPDMERQVIFKARLEKVSPAESDRYFGERPRGSQLGAWASPQSTEIPSREYLEASLKKYEIEFENSEIPRPAHWGGYIARPYEAEFWQGRPNRLHDRILYSLGGTSWKVHRLAP